MSEQLAIHGGPKAILHGIPAAHGGPGVQAIDNREIEAATECLRSGKLFRFHPESQVRAFEQEAAQRIGVKHALMVNSGTSALICALTGLGIGPGDEVIVPAYTYIATAAAVVAVGAVPIIAEIDESLGLDPADFEAKITQYTRAVIAVYMQGVPARINQILATARQHGIMVVEDCCQCIGGEYKGRPCGSMGDAGAWSLNYFKILMAGGEGGLVFSDDYKIYERAAFSADPGLPMWMKETIKEEGWGTAPFSGQCYRPPEILGAIARVQLSKLDSILAQLRSLKCTFLCELEQPRSYHLQHVDDPTGDCGMSAAIILHTKDLAKRFAEALTAEGLPCGAAHTDAFPDRHIYKYWDSILKKTSPHPGMNPWTHPMYKGAAEYHPDMCPRTLDILARALRFSFNLQMTPDHAKQMAKAINKVDNALN